MDESIELLLGHTGLVASFANTERLSVSLSYPYLVEVSMKCSDLEDDEISDEMDSCHDRPDDRLPYIPGSVRECLEVVGI